MSKKIDRFKIDYRISDIQELEVFIPMLPEDVANGFEEQLLDFGFNFDYDWNIKDETFAVIIEVLYAYDRERRNEVLLKFVGMVEYQVKNLKHFIDTDKGEIKFPEEFLAIITGIAISTLRGMIALRTIGKFQGDYYIPILNPSDVVKDYLSRAEQEN